ncbi:sensor histidine kinase [Arthrobacter sp. KK5.5]|uniref:sensor histidine kinase n=1 Tax=Arthrobacter sp. KK5.5 TaxID=3373084 RepID=UPI003EE69D83
MNTSSMDTAAEAPGINGLNSRFHRLGPRARVVLCQLPLAILVSIVIGISLARWPGLIGETSFLVGLAFHAALFLGCFLVPWERLGANAYLAVPLLDLVAIGFTRNSAPDLLSGLGALSVFPVIWLSASGMRPLYSLPASFVGPLFIVLPPFLNLPNMGSTSLSMLLLPVVMVAVWAAVHFASVNGRLQQGRLERKDAELRCLLRTSEERERLLATILETVDVGIAATDRHGEVVLTNSSMRTLLGLPSQEGGQSSSPGRTVAGDSLEDAEFSLWSLGQKFPLKPSRDPLRRAANGETFADQTVWIGKSAPERAVTASARSITDEEGSFRGSVLVYSDVTSLVEAVAAQEDLVSNVSHEFRTPLTSIVGNLDLVLDRAPNLPAHTYEHLDIVRRNAERLLTLVSDLLYAASAPSHMTARPSDLGALVESRMDSAEAQARAVGIVLQRDVPGPIWTLIDPIRIGQVVDNLLSNAIKYSPAGGTVKVTVHGGGDAVTLRVADVGMGMEPSETARVFTRFYRTGGARESGIPGAGLGLAITKNIVEDHGGCIGCTSAAGEGTVFTVVLPCPGDSTEMQLLPRNRMTD